MHVAWDPSDHAALLIDTSTRLGNRLFQFLNMWCSHEVFLEMIISAWQQGLHDPPMNRLKAKLRKVKTEIHRQNKEVFGDVFKNIKLVEEKVLVVEAKVQSEKHRGHVGGFA